VRESVREIAAVAERLRTVRAARHKFLRLWAIDQAMVEPLVDRIARDLAQDGAGTGPDPAHGPRPRADQG
jgi:hypothetical protein